MNRFLMFSYGSNMFLPQIKARTPSAAKLCVAHMSDHKLGFVGRGVANALPKLGHSLPGILYSLDVDEKDKMHGFEGFPFIYDFKLRPVQTPDGMKVVWTYLHYSNRLSSPDDNYLLKILTGASTAGIQDSYIWQAYEDALLMEEMNPPKNLVPSQSTGGGLRRVRVGRVRSRYLWEEEDDEEVDPVWAISGQG